MLTAADDANKVVRVRPGTSPLILAFPHGGTSVPEAIANRLNATGLALADTDWHISRLYDGLVPGATMVEAVFHRYVIDANRPPSGESLYPGQNTTGLCPLIDFDGRAIWKEGEVPDATETEERRQAFHAPYHAALVEQIERVKAAHGRVVLFDCHSIRSVISHLFDGTLPDFNIGTNGGTSCARVLERSMADDCAAAVGYTHVLNGRFKGGWTTREYGKPDNGVHTLQLELAQSTYMEETSPWTYVDAKANRLRVHLKTILQHLESLARGELL